MGKGRNDADCFVLFCVTNLIVRMPKIFLIYLLVILFFFCGIQPQRLVV